MAYNEMLAARVRRALARRKGLSEKKMFGGVAFLLHGKMCCGVLNDDLVVRVGIEGYRRALNRPHARPMNFTGRALKGFVYVATHGHKTDKALRRWIEKAVDFVSSLPAK